MKYLLRSPSPHHFATLGSWIHDAEQCLRWAGPRVNFPFESQMLPSLLETEPCDSYALVDSEDNLAGFGQIFRREPETGHLGRIIIDPLRRKQGVGQILCKELIDAGVSAHGFRSMTLWVFMDNLPAVHLYRTLGFLPEAREDIEGCQFMRLSNVLDKIVVLKISDNDGVDLNGVRLRTVTEVADALEKINAESPNTTVFVEASNASYYESIGKAIYGSHRAGFSGDRFRMFVDGKPFDA